MFVCVSVCLWYVLHRLPTGWAVTMLTLGFGRACRNLTSHTLEKRPCTFSLKAVAALGSEGCSHRLNPCDFDLNPSLQAGKGWRS